MRYNTLNLSPDKPFVQLAAFTVKCGPVSTTQALPPEGDTLVLTNVGNKGTDAIWVSLGCEGGATPTAFYGVGYSINGQSDLILSKPPGVNSIACIGKDPRATDKNPDEWVLIVEVGSRLAKPSAQPKPEPKPTEKGVK